MNLHTTPMGRKDQQVQRSKVGTYAATAGAVVVVATAIAASSNHPSGPNTLEPSVALETRIHSSSGLSSNWYGSAPHVMPLENPPDLGKVMATTGQKAFTLGFVVAPNGGGCTPTWHGDRPATTDPAVRATIDGVRSAQGDVVVSFGGFGGVKLGQACPNPQATADAYQQVISAFQLRAVDFDLEAPGYESSAAVANEIGAAKTLQQRNPGLYVSVTTAGTTAGTGWFGQQVLDTAKNVGFTPENYAIMAFDNGFSGAASQIGALEAFHGILMNTFGWDSATAYAREGFLGMNGRSDATEFFFQGDFQTVLDYALVHKLRRFAFTSVNRDRPCGTPVDRTACSEVPQAPWEFTTFTAVFGNATSPTSRSAPTTRSGPPLALPPPAPTGQRGGAGRPQAYAGCSALPWNATNPYTGGTVVSYGGRTWTAKWWTRGDVPGNDSQGVWVDSGPCDGGRRSAGPCTASSWNPRTAYPGGAVVSYGGRTWTARWWTQGDVPGSNSEGAWADNGPCSG